MKILVLGATGMLGHVVLESMDSDPRVEAWGTARSGSLPPAFPRHIRPRILTGVSVADFDAVIRVFETVRPDAVVNCIGLVKQLVEAEDPLAILPVNSLFTHRLARLCRLSGVRLIHISTDCVFAGTRGNYSEDDPPDALDLYGRSKALGEVSGDGALTLRTSIIGHELAHPHGLVDWFLSRSGPTPGFTRAFFSGLPTIVLGGIIRDVLLEHPNLEGLFHVGSDPISKHDLLRIMADVYGHRVEVIPDDRLVIDRTLDSSRFRKVTGWLPLAWTDLVRCMNEHASSRTI